MRIRNLVLIVLASVVPCWYSAPAPEAPKEAAAPASEVDANPAELMRAIMFPNSNVIFFVQSNDPTKVKLFSDPAAATDILPELTASWAAVEQQFIGINGGRESSRWFRAAASTAKTSR